MGAQAGQPDLIDLLRAEHRLLERSMQGLHATELGQGDVVAFVEQVCRYGRVFHDHLDPLIRRYLPDGAARADRQLGEYAQIERTLTELRDNSDSAAPLPDRAAKLMSQLRNHFHEQEHEVLPRLREAVPDEVLQERGTLALNGRHFATDTGRADRPHTPAAG